MKEKNIVWEMWTDGSVKEKQNRGPGLGRGGGGYVITRWIYEVAEEIVNQSVAAGIWATPFTSDAKAATMAVTVVMRPSRDIRHGATSHTPC